MLSVWELASVVWEVVDPGGGAVKGTMPPLACKKIGQKKWPPCEVAYISCFLARPLSHVTISATAGGCAGLFWFQGHRPPLGYWVARPPWPQVLSQTKFHRVLIAFNITFYWVYPLSSLWIRYCLFLEISCKISTN